MFYLCLVMFGLSWLAANYLVRRKESNGHLIALAALGSLAFCMVSIAHGVVYLWMLVILHRVGSRWFDWSVLTFAPLSLALGVACLGVAALSVLNENARLQAEYPFESMTQRLANRPAPVRSTELRMETLAWLEKLNVYDAGNEYIGNPQYREIRLKNLHENAMYQFVNSPGFGITRISIGGMDGNRYTLQRGVWPDRYPHQTSPHARWHMGESILTTESETTRAAATDLHLRSVAWFAPNVFRGYIRDRDHVAGFVSHGFREKPESVNNIAIARLELVGLAIQGKPVVYVSELLPRMEQLRLTPTRPLDEFEHTALIRLGDGGVLIAADVGAEIRALGAIRAGANCTKCHGCERGDLLGAFSYTLSR